MRSRGTAKNGLSDIRPPGEANAIHRHIATLAGSSLSSCPRPAQSFTILQLPLWFLVCPRLYNV